MSSVDFSYHSFLILNCIQLGFQLLLNIVLALAISFCNVSMDLAGILFYRRREQFIENVLDPYYGLLQGSCVLLSECSSVCQFVLRCSLVVKEANNNNFLLYCQLSFIEFLYEWLKKEFILEVD